MHPAIEIQELVEQILGYLTGKDHGRCASVCKAWSEIALDHLWYHVGYDFGAEGEDGPSFVDLARLIAPVKKTSSKEEGLAYSFESRPGVEAWTRFELKYSKRIRVLKLNFFHAFSPLFKDMNRIRPSSPILPNLHTLDCSSALAHEDDHLLLMFMHNSIQIFSYQTASYCVTSTWLLDLLKATHSLMPRLTSLHLSILEIPEEKEREFAQSVTTLVKNLPLLHSITIPSVFKDISPILSITSRSSALRSLKFHSPRHDLVISSMRNPWSEGEVDYLEELEIPEILDSQMIIPLIPHLCHLRVLRVTFAKSDSQPKSLFDALSRHCSALSELEMSYSEPQILEFDDLCGILTCKNITKFQLNSTYSICFSDAEITRMALAWPQLETLQFSGTLIPEDPLASGIMKKSSLWAVFVLMHLCPNLNILSLYCVNTAPQDTPPFDVSSLPPGFQETKRVANLNWMHFGFTEESGDQNVLLELLRKILPAECHLYSTCIH